MKIVQDAKKQAEQRPELKILFETVIRPIFIAYPEIAWFADENVAATAEGTGSSTSEPTWSRCLMQNGLIPTTNKKYIELERMLHSLVCFHLLCQGGRNAHQYWIQAQIGNTLTFDAFRSLHLRVPDSVELRTAIIASLVYSDLGKTPEAKRRAAAQGIVQNDHDDFMEAVYSAPLDKRRAIIPSFANLLPQVQTLILDIHLACPLHWGHAFHLEDGARMFARLLANRRTSPDHILPAFLIQVCDVAASAAHVNLRGAVAFTEATYLGYESILKVVQELSASQDKTNAELVLENLTAECSHKLGYRDWSDLPKKQLLSRIGAFLRLHTPEAGAQLKTTAEASLTPADWALLQTVFGLQTGVNIWKRNPTYMPTVLLNLFGIAGTEPERYQRVLRGVLFMANICMRYQALGNHNHDSPLCFNGLAGQAKNYSEFFKITQEPEISWGTNQVNPVIFLPGQKAVLTSFLQPPLPEKSIDLVLDYCAENDSTRCRLG